MRGVEWVIRIFGTLKVCVLFGVVVMPTGAWDVLAG